MHRSPRWPLTIALGLATLTGSAPSQTPLEPWTPGTLDIHHIHTGRGNAAFVQFPDGTTLLIDAGAIPETSSSAVGPARPDSTLRPGQWIGRYIAKRAATLDYALVTHYHDDHFGALAIDAPKTAAAAGYKLTGLMDVADMVPIARLFDRGETPPPLPSPMLANYRAFRHSLGPRAAVLEAGRADQITPLHGGQFQVRTLAVNGRVWTGFATQTFNAIPANWQTLPVEDRPNENHFSAAIAIRYGAFDYYTGGDLVGVPLDGAPAWQDMETPIAQSIGAVDVMVLNHHGWLDTTNPVFLAALRPRVVVIPTWHATHPDHGVLRRLIAPRSYSGPRDLFATGLHDAPRAVFSYLRQSPFASEQGHVVIRVAPGGGSYRVFVLDHTNDRQELKSIHGPYQSR